MKGGIQGVMPSSNVALRQNHIKQKKHKNARKKHFSLAMLVRLALNY